MSQSLLGVGSDGILCKIAIAGVLFCKLSGGRMVRPCIIPVDAAQFDSSAASQILNLTDASSTQFEEFFEIYKSSLPRSEQKNRSEIENMLSREDYRLSVMLHGKRVIAFAIVYVSPFNDFGLLEYMATRAENRNQGIGKQMFGTSLISNCNKILLVEVDSERDAGDEALLRTRRKTFYRRLGCYQIEGLSWILPLKTGSAPPLMDLLIHPNRASFSMSRSTLYTWLNEIYVRVYSQSPNDARVSQMLNEVEDPVAIF